MEMNIEGFINALYEKTNSGALGVSYIKPGNAPVTKWFTRDQLDDMAAFIRKCGKQYNTYININPRQNALDTCHRGESIDVSVVVGLYMDFDIKGEAHKEKRLPETAEELHVFIHQLPMKPSIIVVSGNGIHCYWLFKEPIQIKTDDDRDYISGLLSGYEQYASEQAYMLHGWNFDHVADLARMLRAPDTTNFKTSEKTQCRITEASEASYVPSDFEAYAKRILSEKKSASTVSDDADSFSLMGTGSARELIDKCRFLQHYRDDAVNLSEPDWYAAITNLAQTADGHDVIHEISSPYPGYSYQGTERKYVHAAKEDKPVTCDRIKHVHCFDCGKDCGVKAPIALIRTEQPAAPGEWEEPIPFDEFKLPSFPVDALPNVIGDYVSAVAESTQTPVDLPATCALSVMATAEQGKYEIWPKEDWCEPLCLDEMSIMRPSERKSAVLNHMIKPLNKYETEYNFQNAPAFEMSHVHKRLLERQQKALEDQVSKGKAGIAELEKVVGELSRFEEKVPLKLYLDDVTTEKLVSVLAQNKGHAAILSAEGGIFDMLSGIYTKTVKPLCTNSPYGYVKDPVDKLYWIVDEEAAKNVKEVFHLCVQGYGVSQIANEMSKRHVLNPTAYAKANGRGISDNRNDTDDYTWISSTISHMLSRPEYLGHTVNFKTYRKSYKQKKQLKNDPSEWQIFENTHEAIIDQETYDIVQRIRDGRRRWTPMGEMPVLSGMVFCADCGAKLYQVRGRSLPQSEYMVCATYRKKGKEVCPSHQTRNSVIETLLIDGIRSVTSFAREHEDEFVEMVTKKKQAEVDRSLRDGKRELEQAQTRIRKLDEIIQHLYEDNLEGKISDERFMKRSENYENEQKKLESHVAELKRLIASEQEADINVDRFLGLVRKYTEIIREFVDRIYVHQTERINGRKIQRIRIVWNCIGEFTPPVPEPEKETA